ncbi:thioredoxin 1 [Streptococcus pneumoniae]|uniref:thioredoxin n=1 Tax=Staphylococcus warneri TaxID=1292 RepID=UPI0005E020C4|nr:thioredoxin [Staphylococcus warneri]COP55933.1 thioredoxin 1 [Streptococcus pneumoniae]COE59681.1 thioredoxin 1 [Staphylococcus warneri]COP89384.1 thioredoxin 1 [Streptococcus pneumoniae]COP89678.1 thioredoxin 1 [Streptococcus pneumoniae]COR25266.1 thioredoxin 1 [Streptococcus pneumoniae]
MATITVTEKTFNKTIEKGVTLVDFWATWCPPCQMQSPVLEELSDELEGKVIIGKVDVDEEKALTAKYQIQSIPTLLIFKDGELVNTLIGFNPKPNLENVLTKYL